MFPLVSIVIPTYNSAKVLPFCLESIRNQEYPIDKIEIIVVDNFSQDNTVKISKKYTSKVFTKGPERHGQRNYGAIKAEGEYLVFIDSDMELSKDLIKKSVRLCENNGLDALILPEISVGVGFWADCRKLEKKCYLNDKMMETPNRFMKKSVYFDVGGYDRSLIAGEDFDLGDRIKKRGHKINRVDSFIKHHEVRTFWQILRKHYYYGKEMGKYLKKYPSTGTKRFFIMRPAYIRNWRLFVKDPIHGIGLIFMKLIQYFMAGLGFVDALLLVLLKRKHESK